MFIYRILGSIQRLLQGLTQPFRSAGQMMRANPLTVAWRRLSGMGGQFRMWTSMGGTRLRRWLPGQVRSKDKGRDDQPDEAELEAQARLLERQQKRRKRRRVRGRQRRAELSQVHLIEPTIGARYVLHVGQDIGAGTAEIDLGAGRLVFGPAETRDYFTEARLLSASGPVLVNGQPAAATMLIRSGSTITSDNVLYRVELFSFAELPLDTRVDAAWGTNVGPHHDINQDAVGIYQHKRAYLFTLADGVSGGYAGEEVSEYAVKYMLSVFKRNIRYELDWTEVLRNAYLYANAEVRRFVASAPGPAGCTLTTLVIKSWVAYVAHVGDSRLYLLRGTQLRQLTTDHNRVVPLSTTSTLPPRMRTILERAVGKNDLIEPEIRTVALQPNDRLLLATDGVTNNISDGELYQMLTGRRLEEVPNLLIETSNARDNRDNGSVVVLHVLGEAFDRDAWVAVPQQRVFVGGVNYPLKLERPMEMKTRPPLRRRLGCGVLLLALLVVGLLWANRQWWPRGGGLLAGGSAATATPTPDTLPTATAAASPFLPLTETAAAQIVIPSPTLPPTAALTPAVTVPLPTSTLRGGE